MGSRTVRGPRGAVLALAAVLLACASRGAAAQEDTSLSRMLVQVQVEGGPSQALLALTRDSLVLLPLRAFADQVGFQTDQSLPGRVFAGRFGSEAFRFDTERGLALRGRRSVPIPARQAAWLGAELYVATPLLADLFDVEMTADWSDLLVLVSNAEGLPVVRRLERDRRRAVLLQSEPVALPVDLPARSSLVDGLTVDWALTTATRAPEDNTGIQLGVGAALFGGGLEIQQSLQRAPSGTSSQTLWDWSIAWQERRWLKQIHVGDIITGGPRGFPVRGVNVANSPFIRDIAFSTEPLLGRLQPGWEVEVYSADRLIGFTPVDSTGGYALRVPVSYGPNPLQTVAYGPGGVVLRSERTFLVPFTRLPSRQLEYNVGAGECQGVRCRWAGNLDLRYGISSRFTVEGGLDQFWRDSLADVSYAYGLVTAAITRPVALTAEVIAHALARGRLDVDPTPDFHLDASATAFDTTVRDPLIGTALYRSQLDGSLFWRPAGTGTETYVQASGLWQTSPARSRSLWRASLTSRVLGVRGTAQGRRESERLEGGGRTTTTGLDLAADAVVVRGSLHGTLLHAAASAECTTGVTACTVRVARWSAGLGRQLAGALRMDVQVRHETGTRGLGVDLGLTLATPWLRAASRNSYDASGGVAGTQLFEGTVLWDRRTGRVGLSNGRNLGRAGVAGVVFLDRNGDGVRQGEEPALAGVLLRVGDDAVTTDSLGRFSVWDMVPYLEAPIEVDTLALPNPLWYPVAARAQIPPSPNSFRFVTVPIREGGEVSGRVELDGRPLAGAALVLRDLDTGDSIATTTFTDGTFYVMKVPAGRYEVRPPSDLLRRLGVQLAEPARIALVPGTAMHISGVLVRLAGEGGRQ
jgi:hypothetical protein